MERRTLLLFQDLDESGGLTSWEEFVKALLIRFGPSSYDDPMEQLTHLRKTCLAEDYKAGFEALSNRFRGLSEQNKLSFFRSGLRKDIQLSLQMFNPDNFIIAYRLAKIKEENVSLTKETSKLTPLLLKQ